LTFKGGLTLDSGSTTFFQVNADKSYTSLIMDGGTLSYGGVLDFILSSYTPTAGDTFTFFNLTNGALERGDFSSITAELSGSSLSFTDKNGIWTALDQANNLDMTFNDMTGQFLVTAAVPEPSQVAASLLLAAGIAGFVIVKRRKEASDLEVLAA
jgi:hypothetical protein